MWNYDPIPIVVVDCECCPFADTPRCDEGNACPPNVVSRVCDWPASEVSLASPLMYSEEAWQT